MKNNKQKGRRKNMYPLPSKTVLYSHKKSFQPIPQVGKRYHCFDDGKIRPSRHYIVEVKEVLGQMEFKRRYLELFKRYLEESREHYWLFSRSSDKFIVANVIGDDENRTELFLRTKQGGWFSIGESWLDGGKLDIDGSLWEGVLSNREYYDYTDEEWNDIVQKGTL